MPYVITNGENYLTYNTQNQQTMTSRLKDAKPFEDAVRANNYMKCIKKQLQKFKWKVSYVDEISPTKIVKETIKKKERIKAPPSQKNEVRNDNEFDITSFIAEIQKIHIEVKSLAQNKGNLLEELSLIDKEICDIMHHAEFKDLNACDGYKVYKMLKSARIRRRNVKDKLELLAVFNEKENETLLENISTKLESMRHKTYKPRVLVGLFD